MKGHFESGPYLHSDQYYFAKRYFQDTELVNELVPLVVKKLEGLELSEGTLLIGFKGYLALLLARVKAELHGKVDYAIIEPVGDKFIWQSMPPSGTNDWLCIFPVTCSCSTYFRLRDHLLERSDRALVRTDFINVFTILHEELKEREGDSITIASDERLSKEVRDMYEELNWVKLDSEMIHLRPYRKETEHTGHPLVRLYAQFHSPYHCPLCFGEEPDKALRVADCTHDSNNGSGKNGEVMLFPTHDHFEAPNLIFDFNNTQAATSLRSFTHLFKRGVDGKACIHFGHTLVDGGTYQAYIRGNQFYANNGREILEHFELVLRTKAADRLRFLFIGAANRHSSSFLEDLSAKPFFEGKHVAIFRYHASSEYIDNFISLYKEEITDGKTFLIYFDDVLSSGRTFKLLSNPLRKRDNLWRQTNP